MYLMISIMLHYKITPIFVFDGKPPPEKHELLLQRRLEKCEASRKCLELQDLLSITTNDTHVLQNELELLKKQCVSITMRDIHQTKELFEYYGIQYICADGEADHICAHLVSSGKAWGCISDDMDMFVFGCPRVYRHFSLLNHTIIYYELDIILKHIDMSFEDFKIAMIVSGTDYNISSSGSLAETLDYYMKWRNDPSSRIFSHTFYEWLIENTDYIKNKELLLKTWQMFDISNIVSHDLVIKRPIKHMEKLRRLLAEVGFIFI